MEATEETCGRGLASHAPVTESCSRWMVAMAAVLDAHTEALILDDPAARTELEAWQILTTAHRDAAWRLQAAADRMEVYRDLPMARHDPEKMSGARPLEVFERLLDAEQELLDLLHGQVERHRAMLQDMRR